MRAPAVARNSGAHSEATLAGAEGLEAEAADERAKSAQPQQVDDSAALASSVPAPVPADLGASFGGVAMPAPLTVLPARLEAVMETSQATEVLKGGLAERGNGRDEPLNERELVAIDQVYEMVAAERDALVAAHPKDASFCDLETCRRYLVARQWNTAKAAEQLRSTLVWRREENPAGLDFWQSPKALNDPHSLAMRVVGLDRHGRPICYTCFAEAHDRFDVEANVKHMMLLMEACNALLRKRRAQGQNRTAAQRQCVWVIDFDGFGLRDQSPRSAMMTAKLMQHYPESLGKAVLINSPWVFSATWSVIAKVLDDRVRSKVLFLRGRDVAAKLQDVLGAEAAAWIEAETHDSKAKRAAAKRSASHKKYWVAPSSTAEHDPRGMSSYVSSDLYIKTPGDAFTEAGQQAAPAPPPK